MNAKSKIAFDMALNLIAAIIPVAVLQLFIYPMAAEILGDDSYGLMISMFSFLSLVSMAPGNVLNNIRLLKQTDYQELGQTGDFNFLLIATCGLNIIAVVIGTLFYCGLSGTQILLSLVTAILLLLRYYIIVVFRIELNYTKVLLDSVTLIMGYFCGFLLFKWLHAWQLIYICGNTFSIIYVLLQKNILSEPLQRTALFKTTLKASAVLMLATLCSSSLHYVDKILLFPILGGAAVSVYYSATIVGKLCSMAISPISSVMLSYLSKMKSFRRANFYKLLAAAAMFGSIGYFVCIIISKPLLYWLYPEWAAQSLQLIWITTATAMFTLMSSVMNPVVLRFCDMKWQIAINLTCVIVYGVVSTVLSQKYGLPGFAIGVLLSGVLKAVLLVIIFEFSYRRTAQHTIC